MLRLGVGRPIFNFVLYCKISTYMAATTNAFIEQLPKIELHAHLNGSLTKEALLDLGKLKYGETSSDFESLCKSFANLSPSLEECFKKFKIAHDLTNTDETLRYAVLRVIGEFANDNVIYLELRTTPKETPNMCKNDYLQCCLKAIISAQETWPSITVKLIPSIDRAQGVDSAQSTIKVIKKLLKEDSYKDLLKGIDFSGNPQVGNFSAYKSVLRQAEHLGLKLALHCGEVENDQEISEMLDFGMSRIGHGTFIKGKNWNALLKSHIPIECCLSSNVKCGTVTTYNDHHFKDLIANNHPVVLCTDDFGVFDTTLSKEIIIAANCFNLSMDMLKKLSKNAIEASFARNEEKLKMYESLEKYYANKLF